VNQMNRQAEQAVLCEMIRNGQRQIGLMSGPAPKASSLPRKNAIVEENRHPDRTMEATTTDPRGTGWHPSGKQQTPQVASCDSLAKFANAVQRPHWLFWWVCRIVGTPILLCIIAVALYVAYHGQIRHNPELFYSPLVASVIFALWALIWLWRPISTVYVGEVGPSSGNTFRLQRYDKTGSPLPPLPVEMRGRFKGNILPQDRVEVYGKWSRRTFLARRIRNLSTGLMVVKASSMGPRFVSLLQLVALLGFTVALVGLFASANSHPFRPNPLILVGIGVFFCSVLLGVIATVLAKMVSPDDSPANK